MISTNRMIVYSINISNNDSSLMSHYYSVLSIYIYRSQICIFMCVYGVYIIPIECLWLYYRPTLIMYIIGKRYLFPRIYSFSLCSYLTPLLPSYITSPL